MSGLFRRAPKRRIDPASMYFERARSVAYGMPQKHDSPLRTLRNPRNQILAFALAASLAVGGVAASVAITIYGNNSTVAGQLSLGVGQAIATSCDQNTNVHTDTIGNYVDSPYSDFILQQVNVSQVDPNCGGKLMNLVVKLYPNGSDLNLNCSLPASTAFGATSAFSLATFAFATSAVSNSGYLWGCTTGATNSFSNGVYLASIAATAVQIK
jgi:hypothetical protein